VAGVGEQAFERVLEPVAVLAEVDDAEGVDAVKPELESLPVDHTAPRHPSEFNLLVRYNK
jgi:hypothetical protein